MLHCNSWALRNVRDTSCLSVTQISATFFTLQHHSTLTHRAETVNCTVTSSPTNFSLARVDDYDNPFDESALLNTSHNLNHEDDGGYDNSSVNAYLATIRIQQKTTPNNKDNYHHSKCDTKYQVEVEFQNLNDYNLVRSNLNHGSTSLNESDVLRIGNENCEKIGFEKLKMQFFMGPEIDNLGSFVTSLCAAYPEPMNHCTR